MKTPATMIGLAIGDALGQPFETMKADNPKLRSWDGSYQSGDFHKLAPGQWTDDTGMAWALAEGLLRKAGLDPKDMARRYYQWSTGPDFRGAGKTTKAAIARLAEGRPWFESGMLTDHKGQPAYGNGTAMRCAPIGAFYRSQDDIFRAARVDAMITHNTSECQVGSCAVALGVRLLLDSPSAIGQGWISDTIDRVIRQTECSLVKSEMHRIWQMIEDYPNDLESNVAIQHELGAGYTVMETVPRAFFCLLRTDSFQSAVELAVRGGGDADTAAAIVGALAGSLYGLEGIPERLIQGVERSAELLALDRELTGRSSASVV